MASLGLISAGVVRAGWKSAQVGDVDVAVSIEHAEVAVSSAVSMPNMARMAEVLIAMDLVGCIRRWSGLMPTGVKARMACLTAARTEIA